MMPSRTGAALRKRAYTLAESGKFASPHEVEAALVSEGWADVRGVMQSDFARRSVAERCQAAQAH